MKTLLYAAGLAVFTAAAACAGSDTLRIDGAYARSGPKSGAIFLVIENTGDMADRLIAAQTDVAKKTELHTHKHGDDGVMRMRPIDGGIPIAPGGSHALERGGDHVMLMGLDGPLADGQSVTLTLTFEQAGEMTVTVPVDNAR